MASAERIYRQSSPYGCQDRRHLQDVVHELHDPNLPGQMQTTVSLVPVFCGTELNVVQEGIPEAIPLEMCYLGWQESLAQLAKLVEPEIPG